MAKRKTDSLDGRLRQAIRGSGKSANELSNLTGVERATITGFLRGRDMGIQHASKIAAYLGCELLIPQGVLVNVVEPKTLKVRKAYVKTISVAPPPSGTTMKGTAGLTKL